MQNASDTVVDIGMYNTYPVESVLGGALIGLATGARECMLTESV